MKNNALNLKVKAFAVAVLVAGGMLWTVPAAADSVMPVAQVSAQSLSEQFAPKVEGNPVSRVVVRGNQRIEAQTIESYLGIKAGDTPSRYELDMALKSLYATGFFSDAWLSYDRGTLWVDISENPTVHEVLFEGNDDVSEEDLLSGVELKARGIYTRPKVQSDLSRVLEHYRRSGHYSAQIMPKIEPLSQNRVNIVYEIEEGDISYIQDVNFIGHSAFRTSTLRDVVRSQEECWYCFITSNDKFDQNRVEFDKELLRKFYTSQGYADFKVESSIVEMSQNQKDFAITFTIDEGEKYDFGEITIDTAFESGDLKALSADLATEQGELYDAGLIENSIDKIIAAMGDMGFAFVDVRPNLVHHDDSKTIDVVYQVKEGARVYVDRINIKGNVRTLDEVVRREFRLVENDAFSTSKLKRTEERLKNLGFFNKVDIKQRRGSAPDRVDLEVAVEERSTGELSLGAGYSTTDGALADIGIRERNFLGKGQELRFKGLFAARRQQFDIGFTEPYFLDRDLAVGFDLFKTTQDFQRESAFDRKSIGGRLRAGYSITEHFRHALYYSFEQVDISDVDDTASRFIQDQQGENTTSLLGHSLVYDKRNNVYEPTEGYVLKLTQEVAGLGGDSYFLRHEGKATVYYPVADGWTFLLAASGGHVTGYNDKDVRINDRFFLGGRTLRGFDTGGIGPRDRTTRDALGGNIYYAGTAEMLFPLGLPEELGFSGAAFVDAGGLYDIDEVGSEISESRSIRAAAGVGLAWRSPFGPIRLDFAKAFRKERYDETEVFRFNFGTRF